MGWLAVDKNGEELFFHKKPERWRDEWVASEDDLEDSLVLNNGTIRRFIGKVLSWSDEPVEIRLKDEKDKS